MRCGNIRCVGGYVTCVGIRERQLPYATVLFYIYYNYITKLSKCQDIISKNPNITFRTIDKFNFNWGGYICHGLMRHFGSY